MRRIFSVLPFLLFFVLIFTPQAFAEISTSSAQPSSGYTAEVIDPKPGEIIETAPTVTVKFTIPESEVGKKFYLCQESSCDDETGDELNNGISDSRPTTTSFDIKVCAAGEQSLRTTECGIEDENGHYTNYFHGGHNYFLTLVAEDKTTKLVGTYFYMKRYFPEINLQTVNVGNGPKPGNFLKLDITQDITVGGGPQRNNYKVVIVKDNDPNYVHGQCVGFENPGTASVEFPFDTENNEEGLQQGSYTIKVYEQVGEDRPFTSDDECRGEGFLYYTVHFTVEPQGGVIDRPIKDPDKKDNSLGGEGDLPEPPPPPPPCIEGWADENKTGEPITINGPDDPDKEAKMAAIKYCTKVGTALGTLEVEPSKIIGSLFIWILGISGIIAFLIFLYAGYQLMTSSGNKEKVAGARETITSAIVGLLFIIFSIAILEFIGVDILRIPGFSK